jgi:glycyl-tRNA synthetase
MLAILCDAYEEEVLENETREVLRFAPILAPIKVCVMPLVKKLSTDAQKVYEMLSSDFNCDFDEAGTIGKRYRRQDVIGTPWCVTFDYDSLEDLSVTVRHRDSMEQERVLISELNEYINNLLKG